MTRSSGTSDCFRTLAALCTGALLVACAAVRAQEAAQAQNMELVGSHDLQGRSAYQPTIQNQNGRCIDYIGHNGGTAWAPQPLDPLPGTLHRNCTSVFDAT